MRDIDEQPLLPSGTQSLTRGQAAVRWAIVGLFGIFLLGLSIAAWFPVGDGWLWEAAIIAIADVALIYVAFHLGRVSGRMFARDIGAVAIWVLIAVVFFPVFEQHTHDPGQSLLSKAKMVTLGIDMYVGDNDDLPLAANWMDATYPFVKNWGCYRDPGAAGSSDRAGFEFKFNESVAGKNPDHIKNQDSTVLIFGVGGVNRNASGPPPLVFGPDGEGPPIPIGFVDGHARTMYLIP